MGILEMAQVSFEAESDKPVKKGKIKSLLAVELSELGHY